MEEDDKLYDKHTNFLFCTPFEKIKLNDKTEHKHKIKNVSIEKFLNYSISGIKTKLNTTVFFNLSQCSILNDHFCFLTDKKEIENFNLNELPFNYETKLFIYSNRKLPYFPEYIYSNKGKKIYLNVFKNKVYGEQYLLNPKCFKYENQLLHNRNHCLNQCLKSKKNKKSFYNFSDDEIFNLENIRKRKNTQLDNKKKEKYKSLDTLNIDTSADFDLCLNKCPKNEDCFWETYNSINQDDSSANLNDLLDKKNIQINLSPRIYLASYSMNDFLLQFMSLFTLLTSKSIVNTLPFLIGLMFKKI